MAKAYGKDAVTGQVDTPCFICGGEVFRVRTVPYLACIGCGHETLRSGRVQSFILNDPLDSIDVRKTDCLGQFRGAVLSRFCEGLERKCLADIGSASGKFLYQNKHKFETVFGIEITDAAVEFSRSVCGLQIFRDLGDYEGGVSVATCWHSLEHFPADALCRTLKVLNRRMESGGRVIVSVPNNKSWQYCAFGEAYAFFDVPSHLHQFSPESLKILFERFGFHQVASVVSWPYNVFGYMQSLLNVVTRSHNYLYYRFKRRSVQPEGSKDLLNGVLLLVAIPVGCLLGVVDGLWPNRQGVITVCFEKK